MTEKLGTPLENVSQIKPSVVAALRPLWITTLEELVTTAYDDKGRKGLAQRLHMTPQEVEAMAQDLLPLVPAEVRAQIGAARPTFAKGAWDKYDTAQTKGLLPGLDVPKDLPERVSLVGKMPAIRNQGARGTCVAHACAAVREYLSGDTQADFSEQFLYWAARQGLISAVLFGDRPGALLINGMAALQKYGVCLEADWPYNPNIVEGDELQGVPPPAVIEEAKAHRIQNYVPLWARDVRQLKAHLAGGHAVAFTIPTYDYWNDVTINRTGAIRMPMTSDGTRSPIVRLQTAHALCLVGYQDDSSVPGGGYFVIRNSWSAGWAAQCPDGAGYGWLPYDYMRRHGMTAFTAI